MSPAEIRARGFPKHPPAGWPPPAEAQQRATPKASLASERLVRHKALGCLIVLVEQIARILAGGALGDVYGRKRMLLLGVIVVTVASVLSARAGSEGAMLAARALDGIGNAMVGPLALAMAVGSVADDQAVCSASNLAEARCIACPLPGSSLAKTQTFSRPSRAHGPHLRPSTICEKLSELQSYPLQVGTRTRGKFDIGCTIFRVDRRGLHRQEHNLLVRRAKAVAYTRRDVNCIAWPDRVIRVV